MAVTAGFSIGRIPKNSCCFRSGANADPDADRVSTIRLSSPCRRRSRLSRCGKQPNRVGRLPRRAANQEKSLRETDTSGPRVGNKTADRQAQLRAGRSPHTVEVLFEQAMQKFDEAERIRPQGNDDSILRWNRCVRLLEGLRSTEHAEREFLELGDSPPV